MHALRPWISAQCAYSARPARKREGKAFCINKGQLGERWERWARAAPLNFGAVRVLCMRSFGKKNKTRWVDLWVRQQHADPLWLHADPLWLSIQRVQLVWSCVRLLGQPPTANLLRAGNQTPHDDHMRAHPGWSALAPASGTSSPSNPFPIYIFMLCLRPHAHPGWSAPAPAAGAPLQQAPPPQPAAAPAPPPCLQAVCGEWKDAGLGGEVPMRL